MVMMRSRGGMKPDRMFSSVVFPEPVPPEISTFRRQITIFWMMSAASGASMSSKASP